MQNSQFQKPKNRVKIEYFFICKKNCIYTPKKSVKTFTFEGTFTVNTFKHHLIRYKKGKYNSGE